MAATVRISKRLLLINSSSSILAQILNITILLWMHRYLLQRIDAAEYSVYPVIMALLAFTPLLSAVLTGGVARHAVEAQAKGDAAGVTTVVSTILPPLLIAATLLLAAAGIVCVYIDTVLTIEPYMKTDARIMLGLIAFSLASRLPLAALQVGIHLEQKFAIENLVGIGCELLRIALLLILLLGVSPRVIWIPVAMVSGDMLKALIVTTISLRSVRAVRFRRNAFDRGKLRELISFGTWTSVAEIATMIHNASDPIILNKLATPVDVASLHLGSLADKHSRAITGRVVSPIQPMLTAMHARDELPRLQNAYLRASRYLLWASLMMAIPLIAFRTEVIRLYVGNPYMSAATVMGLLMASHPFLFSTTLLGRIAVARNKVKPLAARSLLINVGNVALTLYFVGWLGYGAMGAALGTLVTRVLYQPLSYLPLTKRIAGISIGRWFRETVAPAIAPAAAAIAAVWLLRQFFVPTSWLQVGIGVAVSSSAYVAALVLFALQPEDRADLSSALRTIRARVARRS